MRADFYRMMFQKVVKGIYYTAVMEKGDTGEKLCLAYIADEVQAVESHTYDLAMLVLGDSKEGTVRVARQWVSTRKVDQVMFPAGKGQEDLIVYCQEHGAEAVPVSESQSMEKPFGSWILRASVLAGTGGKTLALALLPPAGKEKDCVTVANLFTHEKMTPDFAYGADVECLTCMNKIDFAMLKCHKNDAYENYCIGTLLLGDVKFSEERGALEAMLGEDADRIRICSIPSDTNERDMTEWEVLLRYDGQSRYLVGSSAVRPDIMGKMACLRPCDRVTAVGEEVGFALSGYLVPFVRKDC